MQNVKNTMLDRLLSLVAPHLCFSCGAIGEVLCDNCKYNITAHTFKGCLVCGTLKCGVHSSLIQRSWWVGDRRAVLQRIIDVYKFQNIRSAHGILIHLLNEAVPPLPFMTRIITIPTAPSHVRHRGYDHARLLAQGFAQFRNLSFDTPLARNHSATQHLVNRRQRFTQTKDMFVLQQKIYRQVPYLIIDDVVTTGATILRVAQLLKDAGVQEVWVAALARQPLD